MISLSILATEIYQKLGKKYTNLNERKKATKDYILTEITKWDIKQSSFASGDILSFRPTEFKGTDDSKPFEVRLIYDYDDNFWELKYGNLNATDDETQFGWAHEDPYRLQKALFLQDVLNKEIVPLFKNPEFIGIRFAPYDGDGLADQRLSYFQNMFSKLDNGKFNIKKFEDTFYITRKVQ